MSSPLRVFAKFSFKCYVNLGGLISFTFSEFVGGSTVPGGIFGRGGGVRWDLAGRDKFDISFFSFGVLLPEFGFWRDFLRS